MPFWGKKKTEVAPIAKNELLQKLLVLNNPSNPFEIKPNTETDLLVEERIVDAKWREGALDMTEKELKKGYKAWLLLDEASYERALGSKTGLLEYLVHEMPSVDVATPIFT